MPPAQCAGYGCRGSQGAAQARGQGDPLRPYLAEDKDCPGCSPSPTSCSTFQASHAQAPPGSPEAELGWAPTHQRNVQHIPFQTTARLQPPQHIWANALQLPWHVTRVGRPPDSHPALTHIPHTGGSDNGVAPQRKGAESPSPLLSLGSQNRL